MKQNLTAAGIFLLLIFLLCFPEEALQAARNGMNLWLNTLIPTLLPFIILTGFLIHTSGIEKILKPFSFLWKNLFGLSPQGAYAFLIGLLCGYPMGAKLSADLYQYGRISRREAEYLLTFSNNASPAFLITYLARICLKGSVPFGRIFLILFLSDFICMLFFRFLIYRDRTTTPEDFSICKKETSTASSSEAIIDVSIMNGFETITRLGGYILLFSILAACINHFWRSTSPIKYFFTGLTEITIGLNQIAVSPLLAPEKFFLSMVMTSFGGLCIMAQTKSVLAGKISFLPYAAAKCLNAAITAMLILVFVKIV